MIDIPESPLRETLDAGIYVEPRDKNGASEDDRQTVVVSYFRRVCKRITIEATPNAAKRTRWAAAKVKREGLLKGSSDLKFWWDNAGHAVVEMKNGADGPDQDQIAYLNWMHRNGHPAAVCRTLEGVLRFLATCAAPIAPLR